MIELRNISKAFGDDTVLGDVSLQIADRAFTVLIGASGAGKTTLLKTINALIVPDSGTVTIDGVSTRDVEPHALRRSIGYVFQDVGMFMHMTVAQNIGITPRLLGIDAAEIEERVIALLKLVGLAPSLGARLPSQLSGGQKQRVGFARALAAAPRILLLDEPFGALDPVTRGQLADDYQKLHRRLGLTSVMVTHDVTEAVLLADRIVVLADGAVIGDGTPAELLRGHGNQRVEALLDAPRRQVRRMWEASGG